MMTEEKKNENYCQLLVSSQVKHNLESGLSKSNNQKEFSKEFNLNIFSSSSKSQTSNEVDLGQNMAQTSLLFDTENKLEPPLLPALLKKQMEQKSQLEKELKKEQNRLFEMKIKVKLLKAHVTKEPTFHHILKLKTDIERLRTECEKLTKAVDFYSKNHHSVPLGETNQEFYQNTCKGQRLQREKSWNCQLCTFRNHPLLNVCEECEMPRILLNSMDAPTLMPNISANGTSFYSENTSPASSFLTASIQEP